MKSHIRPPRGFRLSYSILVWSVLCFLVLFSLFFFHALSAANQPTPPSQQPPTAPATTTEQSPRIVFQEALHDFGTVEQGDQVNHLFKFTNQGTRNLRIESVKTSCGCTAAVISSEVTLQGKKGRLVPLLTPPGSLANA